MSIITREQLRERARAKVKSLEFSITQTAFADSRAELEEELDLARIALASLEAEPVAWLLSGGGAKNNVSFDSGNAYADPLREVTPLYTATPAPVSVPLAIHDDDFEKALSVLNDTLDDCGDSERGLLLALDKAGIEVRSDACRAAILQGVEQQNRQQNIPENIPTLRDGLAAIRKSGIEIDAEKILAERDDLDSPVVPDGWVACSERMPETAGNYWGWWSESKRQGPAWFIKSELQAQFQSSEITHWMPLPAAPQQEDIIC
ncbi:DUF551 domain-containing protein [Enterobacter cloacae]|uniref:DUF551 domain-containing protein n=1 Tax=Enterobacter cloacae TaxID=550 RepID=UPI00254ED234|nr:DUF551 domain-containing protein [Enterobacter cloacae]MDV5632675.1 DUF551 domain-containing protein [Enterobacter cloacae]MDV5670646.1 DUF551 domain-containing protein [Enterobacter cloacae]